MKKTLFLLLFAVLLTGGLQAKPVGVETAKGLGVKFMNANTEVKSTTAELIYTSYANNGQACFYVFALQPKGFVIVAADDRMRPILGYSLDGSFGIPDEENGLQVLFDAYNSDLSQAVALDLKQSPEVAEQWQMLSETGRLSHRGDRSVGPLLTSTWHQTQLYNYHCPEDPEGYDGHVKVGCVASTMSQLMRYWEWPKTGTGSHSYYCSGYGSTSYGTLSANFGEADYRYELMPDFLDYNSRPDEIDAVALLEYHTGVSVEMSYGPNASGAYSADVQYALVDYFRYANTLSYNNRDNYTDSQWIAMLKNEFDNGRPVYYSAYSPTKGGTRGGHAFICDGYDANDFMHFNWGWQGFDNGFYSINAMNLTHHGYNYNHYALVNIHPDEEYYEQPMPIGNLEIVPEFYGQAVTMSFTAPSESIGGESLTSIDSIVLMVNGELIHSFISPQPGANLEFGYFFPDNLAHSRMNYFTIYPVTEEGRGHAVTDSVATWTSPGVMNFPVTVCLHDAAGDGWLSPALSVLDERGIVQYRIGLAEGSNDTVSVDLPITYNNEWTLYWNYCNRGYEDDDAECSFEVYDFQGNLKYAQTARPEVGELCTFNVEWNPIIAPYYITAEYVYNDDGTYGAQVSWDLDQNQWFRDFVLMRFTDPNSSDHVMIRTTGLSYFDQVEPGNYYYRVLAEYAVGGGVYQQSAFAPNLYDPELDYAEIHVTSVEEHPDAATAYPNPVSDRLYLNAEAQVEVYDALGQKVYQGLTTSVDVSRWESGIYFMRITTETGNTITKKIIKK